MHCEGKFKLRSHNTSYCLIEVVSKAGLIVFIFVFQFVLNVLVLYDVQRQITSTVQSYSSFLVPLSWSSLTHIHIYLDCTLFDSHRSNQTSTMSEQVIKASLYVNTCTVKPVLCDPPMEH
jgi:hypothetical protein